MIKEIVDKAKKENKKVYIYAHKFPDGDAICSSRAIMEFFTNQGIDAKYVITKPIFAFKDVVGEIPLTSNVDKDNISLILDTTKMDYAENTLFKNSSLKEDTYILDHHPKSDGVLFIEDDLGVPSENVIRDSNASSACEILVSELGKDGITPEIANILALGLLTDTGYLNYLKSDTLNNLSKLIESGADYSNLIGYKNKKINLGEEVGLARAFLKSKTFPIGDTFGIILSMDKSEVDFLNKTYGVRSPQKKLFKMADIDNCCFHCILAENESGKFDAEFRSTPIYGDFDVLKLAASHGGGGHHSASGCVIKVEDGDTQASIESMLTQEVSNLYSDEAMNLPPTSLSEDDIELSKIFTETKHLTRDVTPELLSKIDRLVKNGVNYDYAFRSFKSYEGFMLKNELLSRIPYKVYSRDYPNVFINLSPKEFNRLSKTYNVGEDEILDTVGIFSNIKVNSATITLPNGKSSHINRFGKISTRDGADRRDFSGERGK